MINKKKLAHENKKMSKGKFALFSLKYESYLHHINLKITKIDTK